MDERMNEPMHGQFPDAEKIKCKTCALRDMTEVKVGKKVYKPGITKAFCAAYPQPPDSNGKPHEVLFLNEDCKYYVPEKAVRF